MSTTRTITWSLNGSTSVASFPVAAREFWPVFSANPVQHLQRAFTQKHDEVLVATLRKRSGNLHKRLVSANAKHASRWLTVYPRTPHLELRTSLYGLAVRQRIDAPLFDDLPETCVCGANLRSDSGHVHWCKRRKAPVTIRHNIVATALNSIANMAGIPTRVELTHPTSNIDNKARRLRPDILMYGCTNS